MPSSNSDGKHAPKPSPRARRRLTTPFACLILALALAGASLGAHLDWRRNRSYWAMWAQVAVFPNNNPPPPSVVEDPLDIWTVFDWPARETWLFRAPHTLLVRTASNEGPDAIILRTDSVPRHHRVLLSSSYGAFYLAANRIGLTLRIGPRRAILVEVEPTLLYVLSGALATFATWRLFRLFRRRRANHCPRCNYDLAGLPSSSPSCPECGASRQLAPPDPAHNDAS